ncbi:hypothetical protein [Aureitalea marina]|uniref:Uncharacterized protein n=1 Tax=Aureitalea marina TaxID=930804 RepID=A0A2S7KPL6_9FLAO|nr:hypothetical protein [Aureitalea marina]PQB04513.1 hypothetical protein BST85_06070 [Aureitalea marina]
MKAASVVEIKKALKYSDETELIELCLRLAKFKKENKELLTYLLFESGHEDSYIAGVKEAMDLLLDQINTSSPYYIRKSMRKVLREIRKYARYSGKKETEVELLLFFCERLIHFEPSVRNNRSLMKLYQRQMFGLKQKIKKLHPDLQHDYEQELKGLPHA